MVNKIIDRYDLMEEQLKDDARSIKFIKNLGRELINKIKLIDKEINITNPERRDWSKLIQEDRDKLSSFYQLKEQYKARFDMITVILNKSDNLISNSQMKRYKERGLDDRFFINIDSE